MFRIFTVIFIFIIYTTNFFIGYLSTISSFHNSEYVNIYYYIEKSINDLLPRKPYKFDVYEDKNGNIYEGLVIESPFKLGNKNGPNLSIFVPHLELNEIKNISDLDIEFENINFEFGLQKIDEGYNYIDLGWEHKKERQRTIFLNYLYYYSYGPGKPPIGLINLGEAGFFGLLSGQDIISSQEVKIDGEVGAYESVDNNITVTSEYGVQQNNNGFVENALSDLNSAIEQIKDDSYLENIGLDYGYTPTLIEETKINELTKNGNSSINLEPGYHDINGDLTIGTNSSINLTGGEDDIYIIRIKGNLNTSNLFEINEGNVKTQNIFFFIDGNFTFLTQDVLKGVFIVDGEIEEKNGVASTIRDNVSLLSTKRIKINSNYEDLSIASMYARSGWFGYKIR